MDPAAEWFGAGFEEWLTVVAAGEGEDPGFEAPPDPFGAAEAGDAPEGDAFVSEYSPRLVGLLDELTEDDAVLMMRAARRARTVEAARVWALSSDEFVLLDDRMSASRRLEWVMRAFVSEVGAREHLSDEMAGRLVDKSRMLVGELPGTLEALGSARISYRHAQVIISQARTLPVSARAGFEEAVLPEAALLPAGKFRKVAVRAREYLHPESIQVRSRTAREERYLGFDPAADGMAWVTAYLPADRAQALFNRVTTIAKSLQQLDGETRTLPQIRADVASDLLLDGQVLDGQRPEGDASDGQAVDGHTHDGQVPDGQRPDGHTHDGQVSDGQHPDGHTHDGQHPDGQLPGGSGWRVLGSDQADPAPDARRLSRRDRRMAKRKGPNWGSGRR